MAATNAAKAAAAKNDVVTDSKEIVEDVVDLVEDTVELVKKTWTVKQNPKLVTAIALASGVAIGAGISYLVLSHRLRVKYQKMADEQVADVRENYRVISKEGVDLNELASRYPDEDKLAERPIAEQIIRENGYVPYETVPAAPEVVVATEDGTIMTSGVQEEVTVTQAIVEATQVRELNLFESDMPDTYFLYEEEMQRRAAKPMEPFVITKEEFDNNETDFSQTTLTYYEGDDVVTDEQSKTIDEVDPVIGPENTLRFGHGSGDPNVVYIRNARLKIDIELVHDSGKYTKEVLGFDDGEDSLRHSAPRRFRPDRD